VIGLIACSKTKLRIAASARALYTSRLFSASLEYAMRNCEHVYVASAMYGLVELDDVLEPYDLTIATMAARERVLWGARVATELHHRHAAEFTVGEQLCILAGASYAEPIVEAYRQGYQANLAVFEPLARLQIGERYAWLQYANSYVDLERTAR
jgi:hypothetical protein